MSNCLCCSKPLQAEDEEYSGWHRRCLRRFFGTDYLPKLDLSEESLQRLAIESTGKGFTVPGVQKKLSLHLTEGKEPRLTLVNYPTGYILKPQTANFPALPEAEYLGMQMAVAAGIKTVPFALMRLNGELAYITRRVDRILPKGNQKHIQFLAMEDFCQLERRLTVDKYKGSYERCAGVIRRFSVSPGVDWSELYLRLLVSFMTGNSDMHLKNFSLLETGPGTAEYKLAPAYDLLPVNVILPEDTEEMALTLNGKKRNLHRNDFLKFALSIGISDAAAHAMIKKVASLSPRFRKMCEESYLPEDRKNSLLCLIEKRTAALI